MASAGTEEVLHYVGYDDDRGGIVSVVRSLARVSSWRVRLGVNPGFSQARSPALPTLELPVLRGEAIGPLQALRARRTATAVRAWLDASPGRIFHGHSRAGLLVTLWLNRWGVRSCVVSVHCFGRHRWFYRQAAGALGRRLLWLSPAMKRYYGVDDGGWDRCIPPCWDAAQPSPKRSSSEDRIRLLGIGALVPWKGWHLALQAIAMLPPALRGRVTFTHIGSSLSADRSYERRLAAETRALGLADSVRWLGHQPSSGPALGKADVLLVSSVKEPFAVSALEASAAGVPVVAPRQSGIADYVVDGKSGWLFDEGDVASLSGILSRIVEGNLHRRVAVDRTAVERFEASEVVREWAGLYATLGEP